MTTGEATAIVTILGSILTFLGITGIDAGLLNQAANGLVSLFTIAFAVYSYYAHRNAVKANLNG